MSKSKSKRGVRIYFTKGAFGKGPVLRKNYNSTNQGRVKRLYTEVDNSNDNEVAAFKIEKDSTKE